MLRKLLGRLTYANVMSTIAVFGVVAGGTAYAANTVFSADIVDGEVKASDIGTNAVDSARVRDNTLNTFDVHSFLGVDVVDGSLTGADISDNTIGVNDIGSQQVASDEVLNDSLLQSDIRAGAVTGDEVLDNSLTGTDINESALSMPPTTTTTFASAVGQLDFNNVLGQWGRKDLPAGSYSVVATVHLWVGGPSAGDRVGTAYCELRNSAGGFMGGATDRRVVPEDDRIDRSLTINGGVQVPAGGGDVSLWCRSQFGNDEHIESQLMITRLDGFF